MPRSPKMFLTFHDFSRQFRDRLKTALTIVQVYHAFGKALEINPDNIPAQHALVWSLDMITQ